MRGVGGRVGVADGGGSCGVGASCRVAEIAAVGLLFTYSLFIFHYPTLH